MPWHRYFHLNSFNLLQGRNWDENVLKNWSTVLRGSENSPLMIISLLDACILLLLSGHHGHQMCKVIALPNLTRQHDHCQPLSASEHHNPDKLVSSMINKMFCEYTLQFNIKVASNITLTIRMRATSHPRVPARKIRHQTLDNFPEFTGKLTGNVKQVSSLITLLETPVRSFKYVGWLMAFIIKSNPSLLYSDNTCNV